MEIVLKFLSVSPEAGEWLKPSPLAGAVNQLTQAFSRAGTQILTISPFYPRLMGELENFRCVFKGIEKLRNMPFEVWTGTNPLYAYIRYDDYFNRPDIYGENKFPYATTTCVFLIWHRRLSLMRTPSILIRQPFVDKTGQEL